MTENVRTAQRNDTSSAGFIELLNVIQGYPLALQQAVHYINTNCITITEYVKLFKEADWYRFGSVAPKYQIGRNSVFTAFYLSVENLKAVENSSVALELLELMAYLDGNCIEQELFKNLYSVEILNEGFKLLGKYSLVYVSQNSDECNGIVRMHSLLQLTIKWLNNKIENKTNECVNRIIELLSPEIAGDPTNRKRGEAALHQFTHLFQQRESRYMQKIVLPIIKSKLASIREDYLATEQTFSNYFKAVAESAFEDQGGKSDSTEIVDEKYTPEDIYTSRCSTTETRVNVNTWGTLSKCTIV